MEQETWAIPVHCSRGVQVLKSGMQWGDLLHGSQWEIVEPSGGTIYSPSGLGGTPIFWCKPVGEVPAGARYYLDSAREDGCVEFCGDSIAAAIMHAEACG